MSIFIPARNIRAARNNHHNFINPKLNPRYLPMPLKHSGGDHVKIGGEAAKSYKHDAVAVEQKLPDLPAQLNLKNGLKMRFGEIIACAGDFYGDPDHPISLKTSSELPRANFKKAYDKLISATPTEIKGITALFTEEEKAADAALKKGLHHQDYTVSNIRYFIKCHQVLSLGIKNLDHFGEGALVAYKTGHAWAMEIAAVAATQKKPNDSKRLLHKAYAIEAFACHFLTDRFSAGHVRVMRREIFDFYRKNNLNFSDIRSALVAEEQHDEDGKTGLWVTGIIKGKKEQWLLVGDGHLSDNTKAAHQTLDAAAEAVVAGIKEVSQSYCNKKPVYSQMDKYFPKEIPSLNLPPLYRLGSDGTILERCTTKDGTIPAGKYRKAEDYRYKPFKTIGGCVATADAKAVKPKKLNSKSSLTATGSPALFTFSRAKMKIAKKPDNTAALLLVPNH